MDEFIIHLEQDSTGSADDDSMDYPVRYEGNRWK